MSHRAGGLFLALGAFGRRGGAGRRSRGAGFGAVAGPALLLRFPRLARGWGGTVLFGRFLVFVAAVVGDVKAAAFEDKPRAGADEPFDFAFAPGGLRAQVFGAGLQGLIFHGLELVEFLVALGAMVLVGGHGVNAY